MPYTEKQERYLHANHIKHSDDEPIRKPISSEHLSRGNKSKPKSLRDVSDEGFHTTYVNKVRND